jgi:phage protein U
MLYALGSVVFEVAPLNVDQVGRSGAADFAEKPLLGRRPSLEFMGAGAEELTLQGRLFPEKLGGLDEFEELRQLMRSGAAQHLIRGDGEVLGWRVITALQEVSRFLDAQGVGRVVEFEISTREADPPAGGEYQGAQWGLLI